MSALSTARLGAESLPTLLITPLEFGGTVALDPEGTDVEITVELTQPEEADVEVSLRYFLNGQELATLDTLGPFVFEDVPLGRHQLAAWLVDSEGTLMTHAGARSTRYVRVLGPCPEGVDACEDGHPCSAQNCIQETCNYGPISGCCEYDMECPLGALCVEGECVSCIEDSGCDDANPCTSDTCTEVGTCAHEVVINCCAEGLITCDDGDPCTLLDLCEGELCEGSGQLNCDDSNDCTSDACVSGQGCASSVLDGTTCDDDNVCTVGDLCEQGVCIGAPANCSGVGAEIHITAPENNETISYNEAGTDVTVQFTVDQAVVTPDTFHVQVYLDGEHVSTQETMAPVLLESVPLGRRHIALRLVRATGEGLPEESSLTSIHLRVAPACTVSDLSVCEDGLSCSIHNCINNACRYGAPPGCCDHDLECPYTWVCLDNACVECLSDSDCPDFNPCTSDTCGEDSVCIHTQIEGCCNTDSECEDQNACTEDRCVELACELTDISATCDTGNPCTDDICDALQGCASTLNEAECDDGDPCTLGDVCSGGGCVSGLEKLICADENPCTDEACVLGEGCVFTDNFNTCDDANICTLGDTCLDGLCAGPLALDCDDNNPCTVDTCDVLSGCVHTPGPGPCEDGNACTLGDLCDEAGGCTPGEALVCDDGEPCTEDFCVPESGCEISPKSALCEDGDPCTESDQCSEGVCVAGAQVLCDDADVCTDDFCESGIGCATSFNSAACDDGDACTEGDICSEGVCLSGGPLDCEDDNPCTTDPCLPESGCTAASNTEPCDDADVCTGGDVCVDGACVGELLELCDDGNPCTDDLCDPELGCTFVENTLPCDDSEPCTSGDVCSGGLCLSGQALVCDDGLPCTDESCLMGVGCQTSFNSAPCDDGNACTQEDVCQGGLCGGPLELLCEDNNPCTNDLCDPSTGCVFVPNSAECDDGNACTANGCVEGECFAFDITCEDDNPCTDDLCEASQGCVFTPNTLPCDDNSLCTLNDACAEGVCVSGVAQDCANDNPCTDEICDPQSGCLSTPNTLLCDDGDLCTESDICQAGVCVGSLILCEDDNPCTDESCVPGIGCQTSNNSAPCDDGDACTTGDQCGAGQCQSGTATNCSDANLCTDDLCKSDTGCFNPPNNLPCQDGDACTDNDQCISGECIGLPVDCEDGALCTDNLCNPNTGCFVVNNVAPCDDGDACTNGDTCLGGVCAGQEPLMCDDNNPCTDESCDPQSGCVFSENSAPCDDEDACTGEGTCLFAMCTKGSQIDCSDGDPCTIDSCDPLEGCVSEPDPACDPLEPEPEVEPEPEAEAEAEAEVEAEVEAEAEAEVDAEPFVELEVAAEVIESTDTELPGEDLGPEPEPAPEADVEPGEVHEESAEEALPSEEPFAASEGCECRASGKEKLPYESALWMCTLLSAWWTRRRSLRLQAEGPFTRGLRGRVR